MEYLQTIMLWITILIMWYVILSRKRGIKMNSEEEKGRECKVSALKWFKRNLSTILAIIISFAALGVSIQANSNSEQANEISNAALYNSEHADEINAKKIEENTCIEILIYSRMKKLEGNQNYSEQINIYLHNSMPIGLKDVEYDVRTPKNTKIQNISYPPYYEVRENVLERNYSIFVWRAIKVNDTVLLSFNLTWNINEVPLDTISHENIFFRHYAGDYPITKVKNTTIINHTDLETYLPIRYGCKSIQ